MTSNRPQHTEPSSTESTSGDTRKSRPLRNPSRNSSDTSSSAPAVLLLEAVAKAISAHQELDAIGIEEERGGPIRYLLTRPKVHVGLSESAKHTDQRLSTADRLGKSIGSLESACSKEMKRLVRTRVLGVVGGARSNPPPLYRCDCYHPHYV